VKVIWLIGPLGYGTTWIKDHVFDLLVQSPSPEGPINQMVISTDSPLSWIFVYNKYLLDNYTIVQNVQPIILKFCSHLKVNSCQEDYSTT